LLRCSAADGAAEFYAGYPAYADYFAAAHHHHHHHPPHHPGPPGDPTMTYLPPTSAHQPPAAALIDQVAGTHAPVIYTALFRRLVLWHEPK